MATVKKIMVPLDGSDLAEKTLPSAVKLAHSLNAKLLLIRVQEPVMHHADQDLFEQVSQLRETAVRSYLEEISRRSELAEVEREIVMMKGAVSESIIESAVENQVDLIMMSSHGRSGISRWIYGSVAEKILRQAPCATIILRSKADVLMFSHRRILVTLDGSMLAEQAIEPAQQIAQAIGAELVLVRVIGMIQVAVDSVDPLVMRQDLQKLEEREAIEAEEYLQRVQNSLAASGLTVNSEILNGPVADTILAYAEQHEVDLIAMSSHGRSGVSRWFYGSVAEKVLRGCYCAMLVTRGHLKNDA